MAKNKTVIKKPSGNGNISITIENNLKNTNTAPQPKKRKKRKQKANPDIDNERELASQEQGPPLKNVSYIKPPSNNFTVWRDTLDSYNTTIPINQAQQMGLITAPLPPPPALPPAPPPLAAIPPSINITNPTTGNDGSSMREFMLAMTALQNNVSNGTRNRIGLQFSNALDDPDFLDMDVTEQNKYIKRLFRKSEDQSRFEDPDDDPEPEDIDQTDQALKDAGVTEEQIDKAKEIKNAKANGLKHGKSNKIPTGKYKDMQEYKDAYAKGLEYVKKQEEDERKREEEQEEKDYYSGVTAGYKGLVNKKKRNKAYTQGYTEGVAEKAADDAAAGSPAAAGI